MASGKEHRLSGEDAASEEEVSKTGGISQENPAGHPLTGSEETGTGAHDDSPRDAPVKGETGREPRKRRPRRHAAENLADLLQKKNLMLQDLEKRLSESEAALKLKDDRILRIAAEFENYKKRTRREWELLQLKANAELLGRIIVVLDDFDRALAAMEGEGDHFVDGVRMIHAGLMDNLSRSGLAEIEAVGKVFDPNFHEAIGEAESDRMDPGRVMQVVQKGYMLHGQILRPARVIVSKSSTGKAE